MSLSDNNPERRNLVVLAFSILIYYIGDATLPKQELTLNVVNISFSNVTGLIITLWASLLWFYLRYWQKNRGQLRSGIVTEINSMLNNYKPLIRYLESKTKRKFQKPDGFLMHAFRIDDSGWLIEYNKITGGEIDDDGKLTNFKKASGNSIEMIIGVRGLLLRLISYLWLGITQQSVGSYLVPQILFYIVLLLGINDLFHSDYAISVTDSFCSSWWHFCSLF
ncbi:MAG: hypothetical protein JAZ17_14955 [Candidatus Thiodiazotropha endolucinida]|nr:hypothetical protein [Candidatus Thiodiazotropha endolucinida]